MIPETIDCVIIGTGLTNSIVAAACSRVGKTVLHVDANNYYGREWASFTFQQLIDYIKDQQPNHASLESIPEEMLRQSRMFCIDLCPRLLYSNGKLVELLVKSNVARYHEFKNNIRILSMVEDELHVIPCKRSDVFTSPLLNDLVDKRRLMKFIEMCMKFNPDEIHADPKSELSTNKDKPISQFLESHGLKLNLREYIINSIAMVDPNESTLKACEQIKRFMVATERFGRSPFLFPLYGCGEFPQSFCRLSAVFGGTYCLKTRIEKIEEESEEFRIKFNDHEQEVKSKFIVAEHSNIEQIGSILRQNGFSGDKRHLSRAILITNRSIVENEEGMLTFLRIAPQDGRNENLVYILELNSSVMVCPPNLNLVHLWTSSASVVELENLVKSHINDSSILWSYFYRQDNQFFSSTTTKQRVYISNPPCEDIDYEFSIEEARQIFVSMFPDQEFLPRAPDPDEIEWTANVSG